MMQKVLLAMLLASLSGMSYAACNTSIIPTAPNSRYQLLNNNTEVKDLQTSLIWQRCSVGQTWSGVSCTGAATKYTWQNAMSVSQYIGGGWRLPNIKELTSLVERACDRPSINKTFFPDTITSSGYWSSSLVASDINSAWLVSFLQGGHGNNVKSSNFYVLLVRSSQ